jgi:hypothetical protein
MMRTDDNVLLEPMYETDEGLEFIVDPNDYKTIQTQLDLGKFRLAFHFQTVDCACIYGVTNIDTWKIDLSVYQYLQKNPYDRSTLFKLLLLGHFDIGIARIGSYHLIKDLKPYSDAENNEIDFHYMVPRIHPGNVAWRSILWDLFAPFVDHINDEDLWRKHYAPRAISAKL